MDVSIIIPLFNRLDLTRLCLQSLAQTTRRVRCEVILVDDGSTDGSREFLRSVEGPTHRVVLNEAPRGYAANNNLAAGMARAPVLCLLNNDTSLLPGWLPPMLDVLRRAPLAGCVGNVQREPLSGLVDHIGVVFNAEGNPVHAGKDSPSPPREPYTRWPAVTAACCLVRRELFLRFGGFDEAFSNGFEDVDFCLRAAQTGVAHYTANRSVIYHHISASPGRHRRESENLALYRARWGDRIEAYRARQAALIAAAQRATASWRMSEEQRRAAWPAAQEERRQHRQDLIDAREDGRRYLGKHLLRPWRYNYGRLCKALVRATHPLPPALIPLPPLVPAFRSPAAPNQQVTDSALFEPPPQ